jgi:hypothetical protein
MPFAYADVTALEACSTNISRSNSYRRLHITSGPVEQVEQIRCAYIFMQRALPAYGRQTDARYRWTLLATAMRTCADTRASGSPRRTAEQGPLGKDLELRITTTALLSPCTVPAPPRRPCVHGHSR